MPNNDYLQQQCHEEASMQINNFHMELTDLTIRYNVSILGDMERRGVINDGPGASLVDALARMELLKQSL